MDNLTPLQKIESEIMALEIALMPKASTAFKNKHQKRLFDLREKRKKIVTKIQFRKLCNQ